MSQFINYHSLSGKAGIDRTDEAQPSSEHRCLALVQPQANGEYRSTLVHELLGHSWSADKGDFGKGGNVNLGNGHEISSEQLRAINIQNVYNRLPSVNLPLRTTDSHTRGGAIFTIPLNFLTPKK